MKLNKLLPIVALSGIATVAMSLVSCSTGGGDTPEPEPEDSLTLNHYNDYGSGMKVLELESLQTFEKDVTYTATIDLSQWGSSYVEYLYWDFYVANLKKSEFGDLTNNDAKLYFNNDVIDNAGEDVIGRFYWHESSGVVYFCGKEETPIPQTTRLKIQFQVAETVSNMNLIFYPRPSGK